MKALKAWSTTQKCENKNLALTFKNARDVKG